MNRGHRLRKGKILKSKKKFRTNSHEMISHKMKGTYVEKQGSQVRKDKK